MLTCEAINTFYGPAHVLFDVDVKVGEGDMVCLIGRNGVGKSTCLKSIMGIAPVTTGQIRLDGTEISALPPYRIARAGIGYVPEDRRVFADLTVEENLEVAERHDGPWNRKAVYELFPALQEFRARRGGLLSGGQQQMLTIARTLVGNPRLLLIDEPTEGLSPLVVRTLEDMIRGLKAKGQTMLLAAQDLRFSLSVADVIYVLDRGRVAYCGDRAQASADIERIRPILSV
ncbi:MULTISPECIES: ABC transporter ATP-binding protein [Hyphomicrobiales]|uniref:ABC transporter ATP-binding protein n=1 Tax=Vineibacter terrae TaxID=2586908 RepID=A0A5C8PHK3_9HYPH|nr:MULTISPECIES: ABC transporter ATP-binding protein [Hyphomicrobiales]TWT13578.1 ABC transporter ATP-binding protein [Reyranella sp. CPCC 100927]TXL73164.1 ABC transporter ATP-binding protein [Vineibacter terrae]